LIVIFLKKKKCGGKICCQAITEDGTRCKRLASEYTTIDFTEKNILPHIPDIIKKNINAAMLEELKLIGFARSCCFYCTQHAKIFIAEKLTWTHNLMYYTTHVEDLLSIFFDQVKPKKVYGITYGVYTLGNLRSVDEIIKFTFSTHAITTGAFNYYYWGIRLIVFFYDYIKKYALDYFDGSKTEKENAFNNVAITASKVLIKMEKRMS